MSKQWHPLFARLLGLLQHEGLPGRLATRVSTSQPLLSQEIRHTTLTADRAAAAPGIPPGTADRDWLRRAMSDSRPG